MEKMSIYDIAKELNISASTVSRALHDHPKTSLKTRQKVKEYAKKINYRPNNMAVALKTGKIKTVGMIVPLINRNYFIEAIAGAESELYNAGYDLIISSSGNNYEREKQIVSSFSQGKVIGVIAAVAADTKEYSHYQRMIDGGVPLVMFDRKMPLKDCSTVTIDDFKGAYIATEHLIRQGCKKIYIYRGPQNVSIWSDRYKGYCKAMEDNGLTVTKKHVYTAYTTSEEGAIYASRLIQSKDIPDGILFSGDFAARAAMEKFKSEGISIPEDVAIVGFVNEPWDILLNPPLSSVEQFCNKIGQTAAQMMLEAIGGMPPRDVVFQPQLIIRESSLKHI